MGDGEASVPGLDWFDLAVCLHLTSCLAAIELFNSAMTYDRH